MEITKESCLKVPMISDKINQEKKLLRELSYKGLD